MTSDVTRFGELLQQYRKRARLTQTELSGFSTVSVRAIRNLELGQAKNPRQETVRLLVDALRLRGAQRAALQLAAGLEADDAAFVDMPPLAAVASRPPHGRHAEHERLLERLRHDPQRFAAICGLGGVGKTRLALAASHTLRTEDGLPTLWFSVPRAAEEAGRHYDGKLQVPSAVWMEGLLAQNGGATGEAVRLIGDRPVLLVVDGNDDDQVSRATVDALLAGCRNLRILETSRGPRGLTGDFRIALRPLPVPALAAVDDLHSAAADPALAILLDRVADLHPDFRLDSGNVAGLLEICSRLDGLPRALESAAEWFLLCSPDELVQLARSEPHLLSAPPGDGPAADWVRGALDDALAGLSPTHRCLLDGVSGWDASWTMEQVVTRLGIGRAVVAGAVDAFLQRGLIRRLPSVNLVVFDVLHVVRAALLDRPEEAVAFGPYLIHSDLIRQERTEERNSDGPDGGWLARGRGEAAGFLRSGAGSEDVA
uniref:Helix-turn-helix domain-containing protein n=1 Tax=Streptomyces sp. NBC_01393 TaxID=2903851 RepID=A0AAU3I071_9ACTN